MNAIKENKLESFSQVTASLFARGVKGNSDETGETSPSVRSFVTAACLVVCTCLLRIDLSKTRTET